MSLTPSQNTALKTHIGANTDPIVVTALAGGSHSVIANWYNNQAVPDYFCWRSSMTIKEIRELVDWSEVVENLTTNNLLAFQILLADDFVRPSKASIRQAFSSIFSGAGGLNSRTALNDAAKRLVTEGEKIFTIGPGDGTAPNPDSLGFEGNLQHGDITVALRDG